MINKILQTLAFILLLSITNLDCFGQTYRIINQFRPMTLSEFLDTKRSVFKDKTLERLQKDAYREGKGKVYIQSWLEFPIIAKGDTMRIRYVFDNSVITHIEIEGVGETTPNDIEKEFFDVTVSPEQTTLYKVNIHVKTANDSIVALEGVANRRVIVVDGDREEYSRIIFKYQYAAHENAASKYRYLNSIAGDVPEGLWVYSPEKLNQYLGEISEVKEEILDTKARLQMETEKFDSIKWSPDIENVLSAIEHQVIARGDSTRIKFLFNNRRVRSIKVLGYGKASKEDIKKGEYVVTVTPKKTKLIECYINGSPRHQRVIVIDPEKYDEVMKEWGRYGYTSRYLDKLAGSVPLF